MIDSVVAAAVYAGMTLDDDDFEHFKGAEHKKSLKKSLQGDKAWPR
jgi:hypothetical protein